MRPEFESDLRQHRDLAEYMLTDEVEPRKNDMEEVEEFFNQIAGNDVGEKIQALQLQKQEIMQGLYRELGDIDDPEYQLEKNPGQQTVYYNKEKGGLYTLSKKGRQVFTVGDLVNETQWRDIDHEGGVVLDQKTVPRSIRKRVAVEKTKVRLRDLLDQQIVAGELGRGDVHYKRKAAYEAVGERLGDQEMGDLQPGIVAEKMVRGYLTKLMYDLDSNMRVEPADAYEDVAHKVDFVVSYADRKRGVGVEDDEQVDHPHRVGIQFTTNLSDEAMRRKTWQIEQARPELQAAGLEDIILVRMPRGKVMELYDNWKKERKIGGPEKQMDVTMQKEVFRAVMHEFLPEDEMEAYCAAIEALNEGKLKPSPDEFMQQKQVEDLEKAEASNLNKLQSRLEQV